MAKRSRKARRQNNEKTQRKATPPPTPVAAPAAVSTTDEDVPTRVRKAIDFGQEYFYVYQEVVTVFVVAALMLVVLYALSFVI